MEKLEAQFTFVLARFTNDRPLIEELLMQLKVAYGSPKRFYHNWQHIYRMLQIIDTYSEQLSDYISVFLACYYHDLVYDPTRTDNESQSAFVARQQLFRIGLPMRYVEKISALILRTQKHFQPSRAEDFDEQLFLDSDLIVLGSKQSEYQEYSQNIRKEYDFLPFPIYRQRRAEVLRYFLAQPYLFRTDILRSGYESRARKNISEELALLL